MKPRVIGTLLAVSTLLFSTAAAPAYGAGILRPVSPDTGILKKVDPVLSTDPAVTPSTLPLKAPTSLTCAIWPAIEGGSNTFTLNWSDDVNSGVTEYLIEVGALGVDFKPLVSLGPSARSQVVTQPQNSCSVYRIYALRGEEKSGVSNTVEVYGFPLPPMSLTAVPGIGPHNSIFLTWTDNTENKSSVKEYLVERTGDGGKKTFKVSGTSYEDKEAQPSVIYAYTVKAVNSGGISEACPPASLRIIAAPGNILATTWPVWNTAKGPVQVSWADNSMNETGFHLEYMDKSHTDAAAVTVKLPVNSITHTLELAADTEYMFRVKAVSGSDSSPYTRSFTLKTPKNSAAAAPPTQSPLLTPSAPPSAVPAEGLKRVTLTIGKSTMLSGGQEIPLDPGKDTKPVVVGGRTLLPARALVEQFGGKADWNADARTVTLTRNGRTVILTIGSTTASIDGKTVSLDTVPQVMEGRTMLPVRFISENLGLDVKWNEQTKTIDIAVQ